MSEPSFPAKRRRRLWVRLMLWLVVCVLLLGAAGAGGVYYAKGRAFSLPDWAQARLEERIAQAMPQVRVAFDEMVVVIDDGWVPRIRLRNIGVRAPEGIEIVRFNELKASFALRPLLSRQIQPQTIAVSGVVARLRRGADGRISLSANLGSPVREAASLPELIGQFDAVLETDALSALEAIELRALTLQYDDLLTDKAWTIDGGRLLMTRRGDDLALTADLALLSGGTGVATLEAEYASQIGETAADFGLSFDGVDARDIATQSPAFAFLDVLRAPISGAVKSGMNEDGRFAPLSARLEIGAGVVQPTPGVRPIPFDGALAEFSYTPREKLLQFEEVALQSAWVTGRAKGTAVLGLDADNRGPLRDLVAQLQVSELSANPNDFYEAPVSLSGVDLDFRLMLDPLRVTIGRMQVTDQGRSLTVSGGLSAAPDGWQVALDGHMDGLAPARLMALWPVSVADKTRRWLDENLLAGQISNVDLALRRGPDAPPTTYLGFEFDKTTVKAAKFMPPVTSARGRFSLMEGRMVVALDEGEVSPPEGGTVALAGSSFIIPDTRIKGGAPAVLRLRSQSSITGALSLLNAPPLSVADKAKLPVMLADGSAVIEGTVAFPLKKDRPPGSTRFQVTGDLYDVQSDVLIKDRTLEAARLGIEVNNESVTLQGAAEVDNVAFDGSFTQPLGQQAQGALRGDVALTPKSLETFGVTLPPGTVTGAGTGRLALDVGGGQVPEFTLSSDLVGVDVQVPQISWRKPAARSGKLEVAGRLGDTPRVDRLEIEGAGLSARGDVRLKTGGALDRVRFDQLRVGGWLDAAVELTGRGQGNPVEVALLGGTLDLRTADLDSGGQGGGGNAPAGPPLRVALDKLQITDTIALTNMQGLFATQGGLDGEFQARLNGGTPVTGRVVPQNGRSAVRLTSNDAGGVLRSAGLLRQIEGGTLSLTLLPQGNEGAFDGDLRIGDVTVRAASGIAALINAISVVGLVNELNGDGIFFNDVEASFRLTPSRLTLTQASAVGNSLGLSMDGIYALDRGVIDMQGVVSPVYLLNGIGSVLTRRGEGLIGFNYTLRGPVAAPAVSVNPLSALTPGMFREIFRAPAPQLPPEPGAVLTEPVQKNPVEPRFEGR
ncbi:YhdP family protein [Sulfitobacter sp. JB4-11]|uniref:YhdP family protein n=1 Tax=Sulfitobacter rhodophyticola TaxID=3238304 RepID=UPI003513E943